MKSRAWTVGHEVTTDEIHPSRYFSLKEEKLKKGLLERVKPGFSERVKQGDVIVAGRYFGMGSGRESAVRAIRAVGIRCIIAESFARYLFRNCINLGIFPLIVEDALERIDEGDILDIDPERGSIDNISKGTHIESKKLSNRMINIIKSNV